MSSMLFESFPPRTGLCGVLQYWSGRCSPRPVTDVNPQGKTKHLTTPTPDNIRPVFVQSLSLPPYATGPAGRSCRSPSLGKCQMGSREWYLAPGLCLVEVWAGLERNVRIGAKASHTDTPASLSNRRDEGNIDLSFQTESRLQGRW